MATRRRRPAQVAEEASQVVTEGSEKTHGVRGAFALPEGHYYYLPSVSRVVHSGQDEADRVPIAMIQQQVGATQNGVYDADTAAAVSEYRGRLGLPQAGLVDADLWAQMESAE
jgi:peptidoglycan hydrolase-like protein with peptidoglycan-binding domain